MPDGDQPPPAAIPGSDPRRFGPRKGAVVFSLVLVLMSAPLNVLLFASSGQLIDSTWFVLLMMWVPGLAAVLTRRVLHEKSGGLALRWDRGTATALLPAAAYPCAVTLGTWAVMAAAWKWAPMLHPPERPTTLPELALRQVGAVTAGAVVAIPFVLGEELGWRGYLLPRLREARVRAPVLLTGLAWGGWHLPAVLGGLYVAVPDRALGTACFLANILCANYIACTLRIRSNSLWPAVFMHGAWNMTSTVVYERFTGPGAAAWIGEAGVATVAANLFTVAVVVCFLRSPRPRAASDRPPAEVGPATGHPESS